MTPFSPMRLSLLASVCLPSLYLATAAAPLHADDTAGIGTDAAAAAQPVADDQSSAQSSPREESEFGTDSGGGDGTDVTGMPVNQIVVQGTRLRGQLDVPQAPLLELGEEDIAAEGVASIADLVQQIQNQTGSARGRGGGGRPVILVNGIRPGSFRELFQYPPEALAKVEVFPEEVATRFGFPPDRRVINLILKEDYSSREVELEFEGPARGGQFINEQEFGYLKIADGGRINFNFTAGDASLLTEDERGIIQTPGSTSDLAGDPDQAQFRSLRADSRSFDTNLSWAKAFIDSGITLSANAGYDRRDNRSLDGLNLVTLTDADGESLTRTFGENDPLERRTASDSFFLSGSFSSRLNAFRVTSTVDGSLTESTTEIDNRFDTSPLQQAALDGTLAIDGDLPGGAEAGFETAFSRNTNASNLTTFRGPLADLPGGELLATFDAGYDWTRIESADTRSLQDVQLTRGNIQTGANFVIPITSRRTGFADALGSFTLNAQVGLEELSDFGTLGDYNASLNWAPTDALELSATYILREVAPGLGQLGNPQITNFNVPVFDFVNGETVLADVTTGGNPDLLAETQRDWKFAVNWELPFVDGTRFTVEYIRNRSDDVNNAFPQITQAIEAAFPDRVTRDQSGRLVAIDRRGVNFAETRADRLQFRLSTRGGFGQRERGEGRGEERGDRRSQGAGEGRGEGRGEGAGRPEASQTDRRSGFMALRERVCADDGLDFLKRLVTAVNNGEDISQIAPGLPPQMIERIIARISGAADGEVSDEQLSTARERICAMDPAAMRGRSGPAGAPGAPGRPDADQMEAITTRLCGDDGLAEMRRIVGMIERGEDVSEVLPGMDPQFLKMGLDRLRAEDGTISDEGLERIRTRICERANAQDGQSGGNSGGGSSGPAFNPLQFGRSGGWRYFANLTHTIELENEILIATGVPVLDQLDGDATGAFGFPRHSSRLEAGLFGKGVGFRLSGRYTGETRLDGAGTPGSSDLFFGDLVTFDLRVFSNLAELTGSQNPVLKNVRISLRMDNIFDGQRAVRDEAGNTPVNYQPFVIDPVGRFIGIDIRKLF
ncbi:MAG: hypothetical protein V2I74_09475 [Erythrobacter sp.]|jgi:hypothetical protein|nr:hypothetical protein [Erythrobacter sp.]